MPIAKAIKMKTNDDLGLAWFTTWEGGGERNVLVGAGRVPSLH